MKEIYRDLSGYEGYQISNLGNVYSLKNKKIISYQIINSGYKLVHIYVNNKRHAKTIHRLVAQEFIPNPENKPFVNHKDGNRLNNVLENLEWVTSSENMQHAMSNGLVNFDHVSKPVIKLDLLSGKLIKRYKSIASALDDGYKNSAISMCIRGSNNSAHGFKWVYEDDFNKNQYISPVIDLYNKGISVNGILCRYPSLRKEDLISHISNELDIHPENILIKKETNYYQTRKLKRLLTK
jgi:hypothetical protein